MTAPIDPIAALKDAAANPMSKGATAVVGAFRGHFGALPRAQRAAIFAFFAASEILEVLAEELYETTSKSSLSDTAMVTAAILVHNAKKISVAAVDAALEAHIKAAQESKAPRS